MLLPIYFTPLLLCGVIVGVKETTAESSGGIRGDHRQRRETDEQRLLNRLLDNYDSRTRPVMNASTPVRVRVGLTLNQIFDVDEKNQVLTSHIWLDQEWHDEKMYWDPAEYNELKTLRVPSHLIWKPDVVLYNSADDYTTGYMPALAMVSHDGHIFWPPIVKLRSTCQIDITYFPFDDQTCSLKLGSWAYDGFQVDILKRETPIDLSTYVSNGEWELMDVKVERNVQVYGCCPEPYPDVTFTLHIRRRTLYYTYNVIIPCVMLSCLSLLGFWMPPETGEKVALGLTILLAFSVFMLLIAESMPASSFYIPLIGMYIIAAMCLTAISVCCAVAVSYIHHQGNMGKDIPAWFQKIGRLLKKVVFVTRRHDSRLPPSSKSPSTTETTPDLKTPLHESFNSVNFSFRSEENGECELGGGSGTYRGDGPRGRRKRESSGRTDEIIKKLDLILRRQEELVGMRNTVARREWHEAAEAIDRALFWLYLIVTITVTISILVLQPLGKQVSI